MVVFQILLKDLVVSLYHVQMDVVVQHMTLAIVPLIVHQHLVQVVLPQVELVVCNQPQIVTMLVGGPHLEVVTTYAQQLLVLLSLLCQMEGYG